AESSRKPQVPSTAVKSACTSARLSAGRARVCRAGRDSGSGNIFTHSVFSVARCDTGSLTQKLILTISSTLPPAASTSRLMWATTLAPCASRLAGNSRVPGLVPPITLDITTLRTRLALGIGFSWRALLPLMLLRFAIVALLRGRRGRAKHREFRGAIDQRFG